MRHPSMTTRGTRIAVAIAALVVLALPKRLPCSYPDEDCADIVDRRLCRRGELEPLGFYLLERVLHRDVGFAYASDRVCD